MRMIGIDFGIDFGIGTSIGEAIFAKSSALAVVVESVLSISSPGENRSPRCWNLVRLLNFQSHDLVSVSVWYRYRNLYRYHYQFHV